MNSPELFLPDRPIQVAPKTIAFPAGFLFTVIILGALLGFFAWWQGPGLWRDIQISQNPQVLPNADVLDGECSTRRGLTDCDARLVYDYNGESHESYVSIAFLDFTSGDYEVEVVVSRNKPELATISLGLDMLWNRLIVFAVFMLLFAGGTLAMLVQGYRAWRANNALRTPQRLRVVPVELIEVHKALGSRHASYVDYLKGPKSRRMTRTRLRRGEEPLMAVDANGTRVALAAVGEHGSTPVLLDSNLERLDLTAEERQQALANLDAQAQAQANAPMPMAAPPPQRSAALLRSIVTVVLLLVVFAAGLLGYWFYYVTSAGNAFDSIGMEINNIMPEPINRWGCEQLEARFGDSNAPFGCVADDYVSWKTADPVTKTKTKS